MTPRETEARKAIDRLGEARLLAFFRAIAAQPGCLAVDFLTRALSEGATLESVFFTGEAYGYHLHVKGRGRKYRIAFGCVPGPLIGDGGEWTVEFDRQGGVLRAEAGGVWVS